MATINSYLLPGPEGGPGWGVERERAVALPELLRRVRAAAASAAAIAKRVVDTSLAWRRRAIERGRLAALDERLLKDIGINRLDVLREVSKPVWQD